MAPWLPGIILAHTSSKACQGLNVATPVGASGQNHGSPQGALLLVYQVLIAGNSLVAFTAHGHGHSPAPQFPETD
jgi:hypothetical protein